MENNSMTPDKDALIAELVATLKKYHNANRCKHDGDWELFDVGEAALSAAAKMGYGKE